MYLFKFGPVEQNFCLSQTKYGQPKGTRSGKLMFDFLRPNPLKRYRKRYQKIVLQAQEAQRCGNIRLYSELAVKSASIYQKIRELEAKSKRRGQYSHR